MLTSILHQVLRGYWMMEPSAAESYAQLVQSLLAKQNISLEQMNQKYVANVNQLLNIHQTSLVFPQWNYNNGQSGYDFNATAEGTIAVIPFQGAVMRQDYCGALGLDTITSLYQKVQSNPNIIGSILYTDSPGGVAVGLAEAASNIYDIIRVSNAKPSATYIESMMCSAAAGIGTIPKFVVANRKDFCMIGSVGTFASLNKKGPMSDQTIEVYAPESVKKNYETIQALDGNPKPMQDNILTPLNNGFKAVMNRNRYGKMNKAEVFSAAAFQKEKALEYGLVDKLGTFQDAVDYINQNAKK